MPSTSLYCPCQNHILGSIKNRLSTSGLIGCALGNSWTGRILSEFRGSIVAFTFCWNNSGSLVIKFACALCHLEEKSPTWNSFTYRINITDCYKLLRDNFSNLFTLYYIFIDCLCVSIPISVCLHYSTSNSMNVSLLVIHCQLWTILYVLALRVPVIYTLLGFLQFINHLLYIRTESLNVHSVSSAATSL